MDAAQILQHVNTFLKEQIQLKNFLIEPAATKQNLLSAN